VSFWGYETRNFQKKFEHDLLDKVRWIAIKSYMGSIGSHGAYKEVRDRELFEYIESEQYNLKVEKEFCIDFSNEKEKDFICKILDINPNELSNPEAIPPEISEQVLGF
jgi:hypothetical protein